MCTVVEAGPEPEIKPRNPVWVLVLNHTTVLPPGEPSRLRCRVAHAIKPVPARITAGRSSTLRLHSEVQCHSFGNAAVGNLQCLPK